MDKTLNALKSSVIFRTLIKNNICIEWPDSRPLKIYLYIDSTTTKIYF